MEDIARFLRSREFRVGLLFTNYEGQPNAILDYIESGIPVVATDLQPIKEVLSKENESFLYSNYHVDQICQGIIEISNSQSLSMNIVSANYKKLLKHAPDVIGENYWSLIQPRLN